jgi:hypothetical protein
MGFQFWAVEQALWFNPRLIASTKVSRADARLRAGFPLQGDQATQ